MSSKSSKGPKKMSLKPQEPRELAEIQAEYNELAHRAGQIQYQIYVYNEELRQINDRLRAVNNEAAARNALTKASETKQEA